MKTMIKKSRIFLSYFIIALAVMAVSCSAEDGTDGIDGTDGVDGEQGEAGTANVIFSEWMPIVWNTTDGTFNKDMQIDEPLITTDFIENGGTVLMFLRQTSPPAVVVFPLPFQSGNDKLSYIYANYPGTLVGIQFSANSIDGSTPVDPAYVNPIINIRYILIPGGVPLGEQGAKGTWARVNKKDYHDVVSFLGIKD